jgi:1,4-dihydroxy-6-naphthoate synthase
MRNFQFGCTPCPNDLFSFEKILTEQPKCVLEPIETLCAMALKGVGPQVLKISAACLPYVQKNYFALSSGVFFSLYGGPKLVSTIPMSLEEAMKKTIAIPGVYTTAFTTFKILYGPILDIMTLPSFEILPSLMARRIDVGLVIHEPMATESRGLFEICDIGQEYRRRYNEALPLGVLVAQKSLRESEIGHIDLYVQKSVRKARRGGVISDFVLRHAQGLSKEVIAQHIASYVNEETEKLSKRGKKALDRYCELVASLQ